MRSGKLPIVSSSSSWYLLALFMSRSLQRSLQFVSSTKRRRSPNSTRTSDPKMLSRLCSLHALSVQEFLTSDRLQDQSPKRLSRYHVLPQPAHTFFAKACLSVLLQLTPRIHKNRVKGMFPLAPYAAEHWVGHAQRGDVTSLTGDGIGRLFEDTSHFAAWIWVFDLDNPSGPHMDSTTPEIPEIGPNRKTSILGVVTAGLPFMQRYATAILMLLYSFWNVMPTQMLGTNEMRLRYKLHRARGTSRPWSS